MRKTLLASALMITMGTSAFALADTSVNGTVISQDRIDAVVQMMAAQSQGQPLPAQAKDMAKDQLIATEVLRQEAVKKGLDKSAEYHAQLDNMQAMLLAQQLIKDYQKTHPITEATLKAEYDKAVAAVPETKQYHAYHILVKTQAEANAVIASLKKGKSFEALAKEKSNDPGSKNNGGDLGWQDPGTFVPEFSQALVKLNKGQVTATPVKTQFGWHIIKLADIKTERNVPSFEDVKPQLTQKMQGEAISKYVDSLKAQAKIQQ